jgi:hypothetical protein
MWRASLAEAGQFTQETRARAAGAVVAARQSACYALAPTVTAALAGTAFVVVMARFAMRATRLGTSGAQEGSTGGTEHTTGEQRERVPP